MDRASLRSDSAHSEASGSHIGTRICIADNSLGFVHGLVKDLIGLWSGAQRVPLFRNCLITVPLSSNMAAAWLQPRTAMRDPFIFRSVEVGRFLTPSQPFRLYQSKTQ